MKFALEFAEKSIHTKKKNISSCFDVQNQAIAFIFEKRKG